MNMKSYLILFSLLILVVSSFEIQESFADESGIYQLQCNDGTFEIPYQISNGKITNMDSTSNRDLKISIKEATNGNITVNIPRSFVDAKIAGMDDTFFVLVNKNEIYWEDQIEVRNPTIRILTIPFPEGDVTIDVIAGGIPERPRTRNCSAEEMKVFDQTNNLSKSQTRNFILEWIRNNSKMWSEGRANDSDFITGIQYLITEGTLSLPEWYYDGDRFFTQVPAWLKNNAGWWADGLISDDEYLNGLLYLLNRGIISV